MWLKSGDIILGPYIIGVKVTAEDVNNKNNITEGKHQFSLPVYLSVWCLGACMCHAFLVLACVMSS